MTKHQTLEECIPDLDFEKNTAGRDKFIENNGVKFQPTYLRTPGDCAVIAVALARNEGYCCSRKQLQKRWKNHHPHQKIKGQSEKSWVRKAAMYIHQSLFNDHDPIWGTPSIVYGNALEFQDPIVILLTGKIPKNDFDIVYGEDAGNPVTCICDEEKAFVIDGYIGNLEEGKHHVTTILAGTIVGDRDIRHDDFHIVHVWRSNYKSTTLEDRENIQECTRHKTQFVEKEPT